VRLAKSAQITVLEGAHPRNPFPMYIAEILETEGFCYRLANLPDPRADLLIVPHIELSSGQCEAIRVYAGEGGNVLGLRPPPELFSLFGLQEDGPARFTWADRYLRLRDDTVLQFHGPADLLKVAGAETLAALQSGFEDAPDDHPAVVRLEDGGRRAAFTFDLARCCVLFHQGRLDQAGDGPNPDPDGDGMFKPNDLFVNYLDPRCKLIPQADVLQDLLVELIYWLTEKASPIPRLWHFPHAQPALAFITGDSDWAPAQDLYLAFETAQSFGVPYTLYLMTENYPTLPPEGVESLQKAGHDIGLHPWHSPTPTVPQFREHLMREYEGFRERYGYLPATVRNHSCIIAGWVDTPDIYREIGLRMDLNPYSIRGFQYGYLTGTGLPVRYMDLQGRLIDFYQQSTLTSDDCMLEAKSQLPPHTVDGAIAASLKLLDDLCQKYHGVYQPCFHPVRLRSYPPPAIEWFRAMLEAIRSRRLLSLNGQEWCAFNDARRAVRIEKEGSVWKLKSPNRVSGLTLLWPEQVRTVAIDGQRYPLQRVGWGGVEAGWVKVDVSAGQDRMMEVLEWKV